MPVDVRWQHRCRKSCRYYSSLDSCCFRSFSWRSHSLRSRSLWRSRIGPFFISCADATRQLRSAPKQLSVSYQLLLLCVVVHEHDGRDASCRHHRERHSRGTHRRNLSLEIDAGVGAPNWLERRLAEKPGEEQKAKMAPKACCERRVSYKRIAT
eukprot:scaffold7063_cov351-Pinguiococcus_pyrenoidosus.AAC.11